MNAVTYSKETLVSSARKIFDDVNGDHEQFQDKFYDYFSCLSADAKAAVTDYFIDEIASAIYTNIKARREMEARQESAGDSSKSGEGQRPTYTQQDSSPPRSQRMAEYAEMHRKRDHNTHLQRRAAIAPTIMASWLDVKRSIIDGRPIGDLTAHELRNETRAGQIHGKMCELLSSGMPEIGPLRRYKSSDDVKEAWKLAQEQVANG